MTQQDLSTALRMLLSSRSSRPVEEIDDAMPLDGTGLGLDSIAIAELLLECQRRFEVDATPLLDGATITVGRLVAFVTSPQRN